MEPASENSFGEGSPQSKHTNFRVVAASVVVTLIILALGFVFIFANGGRTVEIEYRPQSITYDLKATSEDEVVVLRLYIKNRGEVPIDGDIEVVIRPDLRKLSGAFLENYRRHHRNESLPDAIGSPHRVETLTILARHMSEWKDGMGVPDDFDLTAEPDEVVPSFTAYKSVSLKPGAGGNIDVPLPMPMQYYKYSLRIDSVKAL